MSTLDVSLLGRFRAERQGEIVAGLDATRVQAVFSYLLLHRGRSHSREAIASALWGDNAIGQARKYLRQALWQLHTALNATAGDRNRLLLVEQDDVKLDASADVWLDVAVFERAFTLVQGVRGEDFDARQARAVQDAVALYRGDLLQDWYDDWCLYERERLQNMYLALLDKLMDHFDARRDYERSIVYGMATLRYERARESTHRRLMRLHYLAGDRTTALRQYERCVAVLSEELDVSPAKQTQALYEAIRADHLDGVRGESHPPLSVGRAPDRLPDVLDRLEHFRSLLDDVHRQVQRDIQAIERAMLDTD